MSRSQICNATLRCYHLNNLGPEGSETVSERNQRKRLEMWQENLQRQQKKQEKQQKVNFCTLDAQISFAVIIGSQGNSRDARPLAHSLSSSCSFRRKMDKIIDWCPRMWGSHSRLQNPGYTTHDPPKIWV